MRKRRHKRIIKRLEMEFSANGMAFRGVSSNLSRSGIFVRTNKPFPVDTLVDLTIYLPGDKVSRVKGSVRRAIKIRQAAIKNGMAMEIVESDQNYINFFDAILPGEEPLHHVGQINSEAFSPPPVQIQPAAPQEVKQDSTSDDLDSMISNLFSKGDNR